MLFCNQFKEKQKVGISDVLLYRKKADVLGLRNFSLNQAKITSGYIEQPFSTVFYLTKIRKLYSAPQFFK